MSAIEQLVRLALRETPYCKHYPSRVERTLSDGITVMPDDATMGGSIVVPKPPQVEHVAAGVRCLLAFRSADPTQPYIAAWEGATRGNVISFRGGKRRVARMGDFLEITTSLALKVNGTVEGQVTIPGTPPVVVPLPPTPFNGLLALVDKPIGFIATGNPKLLA